MDKSQHALMVPSGGRPGISEGVAMAHAQKRKGANEVVLNVRKLESLRAAPGQERTEYRDVGLRGFGVRVAASGRKTFTVRYLVHGHRSPRDLGVYGVHRL